MLLHQPFEISLDVPSSNKLTKHFASKFVDKKSRQSTFIKPVDNLQQTCYRQAGASDANAF